MKKLYLLTFLTALFLAGCQEDLVLDEQSPTDVPLMHGYGDNGKIIPNHYIVVFKEKDDSAVRARKSAPEADRKAAQEESLRQVRRIAADLCRKYRIDQSRIRFYYHAALQGIALEMRPELARRMAKDERVRDIEEDRIVTMGPPPWAGGGGGGGGGGGQTTPYGITRVNGGATYTGSNVAWIIDSGIDLDHPDLNVDATNGFSAWTKGPNAGFDDGNGHGSHVAGTIAAVDNTEGVIGVAAGASVVPIKVLDKQGSGSYSGVIAGVDHVAANGNIGDVANMSLGGPTSSALDNAVSNAASGGIKFVLAAGNESQNANNSSPARVNGNNIYTISAMDINDNWASFSNYANPPVDYCAPGVGVESTYKGGGYATLSGTSMAAPHVAGILLLGTITKDGTVNNDPDGNPDDIAVH